MIEINNKLIIGISVVVISVVTVMAQGTTFDTHFVELDTSKMIHTGDSNYAINQAEFLSNWRSVSVNGNEITIVTRDGKSLVKNYNQLTLDERNNLDNVRNTLTSMIRNGPYNVNSKTGLAKLTTFDRNGGSSVMGSGGGGSSSSSSSSSSSGNGSISIQRTGKNSSIVSKQDFPFNWHRLFLMDDLVTVVYKTGRVVMMPESLMKADERAKVVEVRAEVDKSSKAAEHLTKSFSFHSPMDFVSKALGGLFGR